MNVTVEVSFGDHLPTKRVFFLLGGVVENFLWRPSAEIADFVVGEAVDDGIRFSAKGF